MIATPSLSTNNIKAIFAVDPAPKPQEPLKDPLINYQAEQIVYLGVFLLAAAAVAVVGIISRRIEHALMFAAFLSIIIITFIVFLSRD